MFGRIDLKEAIKNGDLARVQKAVKKNPKVLKEMLSWKHPGIDVFAHPLGYAAYCNQPELVQYFVDQGMSVGKTAPDEWAPLHYAALGAASLTTELLLKLGADPLMENCDGKIPSAVCESRSAARTLLEDAVESIRNKETEEQQAAAKIEEAQKAAGEWTLLSDDEVMLERELPGGNYRLTSVFNFAAKSVTTITKDLKSGQVVPQKQTFKQAGEVAVEEALNARDTLNGDHTAVFARKAASAYEKLRNFK